MANLERHEQMPVIVFRTDASLEMGSGHVMRCLTLAMNMIATGAHVLFVCRELPGNLCGMIDDSWGISVYRLPHDPRWTPQPARNQPDKTTHAAWLGADWQDDADQTALAISSQFKGADWLVVDHYALDARWEAALRPSTRNLMVIDDLADRSHDCDVLLDQNLQPDLTSRYDNLTPTFCLRLLGPHYALLRQEFDEARAKLRVRDGVVRRLLIFFGGSDASNETAKALEAVKALNRPDIEVDVIVGTASPNLKNIRSLCNALPRTHLYQNPQNIAEIIGNADLAVGAAGTTTWERCCLGLPSIVISLAMNQESIARALADNQLAVYLGTSVSVTARMIAEAIEKLMNGPDQMQAMSRACVALVDGRGTGRVARVLDTQPIVLRRAHIGDRDVIHQWRNADVTRCYSRRPDPIPLQQHRQWYNGLLRDRKRVLLIGERDHQPIGVLRYDYEAPRCTVSIYLVPDQHGHDYGPRLLKAGHEWLQQHHREIKQVRAEVLASNRASIGAFLQAGYRRQGNTYIKNLD